MTRTGRIVAGIGSAVLGLLAVVAFSLLVSVVVPDRGVLLDLVAGLLSCAVFGVVAAAFYTWTVDGSFVMPPRRGARR